MISILRKHPFAVEAFFESSLVLTFAVPKEELQPFIPECLTLDTHKDTWAFVAMAMVQTKALRPKGFPRFLGNDFFLIGYRIFVKYVTCSGKRLRGLYILKSETDSPKMRLFGNIFTKYKYTTTDIAHTAELQCLRIKSIRSAFEIEMETRAAAVPLPLHSPFSDWKEARRFAGPLPFTFSYDAKTKEVLIIEGVRQHWQPQPVCINGYKISFLDTLGLQQVRLANAFIVTNVPYHWKKGRTEIWSK